MRRPWGKGGVVLRSDRHNLDSWRATTRSQYFDALKVLAGRLGIVLGLLAAVWVVAEVWRRAVVRYVREPPRRYQLLLGRAISTLVLIVAIVGLSFVTRITNFA